MLSWHSSTLLLLGSSGILCMVEIQGRACCDQESRWCCDSKLFKHYGGSLQLGVTWSTPMQSRERERRRNRRVLELRCALLQMVFGLQEKLSSRQKPCLLLPPGPKSPMNCQASPSPLPIMTSWLYACSYRKSRVFRRTPGVEVHRMDGKEHWDLRRVDWVGDRFSILQPLTCFLRKGLQWEGACEFSDPAYDAESCIIITKNNLSQWPRSALLVCSSCSKLAIWTVT